MYHSLTEISKDIQKIDRFINALGLLQLTKVSPLERYSNTCTLIGAFLNIYTRINTSFGSIKIGIDNESDVV